MAEAKLDRNKAIYEERESGISFTELAEKYGVKYLLYPSILKEGFMESLSHLGCQAFLSLDMNSLTDEEQLDFNRAIEKRYRSISAFSKTGQNDVLCIWRCKLMFRKDSITISEWIKNSNKALLVTGARQTGKTWLIRDEIDKSGFKRFVKGEIRSMSACG